jgi:ribulose-phosphate 3-epimerase
MITIVPAILTNSLVELENQLERVNGLFPYVHIDVMDGEFVKNKSFREISRLPKIFTAMQFELHLMVNDPIKHMREWQPVEQVFRVLIHREAKTETINSISFAKKEGWEIGLVLKPDTDLNEAKPFFDKIDVLQFMTVHPGKQGAEFQKSVLPKIKEFSSILHHPRCAADGAINLSTIKQLHENGVEIFNVGSALMGAPDIKKALADLYKALS